jgi:hypothetical protein
MMTQSKLAFVENEEGFLTFPSPFEEKASRHFEYLKESGIGVIYLALDTYPYRLAVHHSTPYFQAFKRKEELLRGTESSGFIGWIDLRRIEPDSILNRFLWREGEVVELPLFLENKTTSQIEMPFPPSIREPFIRTNWWARKALRENDSLWVHYVRGRRPSLDLFSSRPTLRWRKDKLWGEPREGDILTPEELPVKDGRMALKGEDSIHSIQSESLLFSSEELKVKRALFAEGRRLVSPTIIWRIEREDVEKILEEEKDD